MKTTEKTKTMKTIRALFACILFAAAAHGAPPPKYVNADVNYQQTQELETLYIQQGANMQLRVRPKINGDWMALTGLTARWEARATATNASAYQATSNLTDDDEHFIQMELDNTQTGTAVTGWRYSIIIIDGTDEYPIGIGEVNIVASDFAGSSGVLTGSGYEIAGIAASPVDTVNFDSGVTAILTDGTLAVTVDTSASAVQIAGDTMTGNLLFTEGVILGDISGKPVIGTTDAAVDIAFGQFAGGGYPLNGPLMIVRKTTHADNPSGIDLVVPTTKLVRVMYGVAGADVGATFLDGVFTVESTIGFDGGASFVTGDVVDWGTAFGWGDHASAGYLTHYTETDPIWVAAEPAMSASAALADSAVQAGDPVTVLDGAPDGILVVDGSGDVVEIAYGTTGKVLTSSGASSDPTWETSVHAIMSYFSGFSESFAYYVDLALWMPFTSDETPDYIDKGPLGNNGSQSTASSQPTWSSSPASYSFDGVDDWISTTLVPSVSAGLSYSVWAYADSFSTSTFGYLMGGSLGGDPVLRRTTAGSGAIQFYDGSVWVLSDDPFPVGSWVHIVGTVDASDDIMLMYVDGVRQADTQVSADWDNFSTDTRVGWSGTAGATQYFDGKIGDVRIYNRGLTAAEILAIADNTGATYYPYFSGFTESFDTYADLALWFPFDSDETPDYIDKGQRGNDGSQTTASSQPTWSSADGGVYDFDGIDDYIDMEATIAGDYLTISLWFYNDAIITPGYSAASPTFMSAYYDKSVGGYANFGCSEKGGLFANELLVVRLPVGTDAVAWDDASATIPIGWHHVALRDNGTRYEIWYDGSRVDNATYSTPDGNYLRGKITIIGGEFGSSVFSQGMDGKIDDVRVYSTALTTDQVRAIYNNTRGTYGL